MTDKQRLEAALAYRNDDVVHRFLKLYDIPEEEAEELFVETLKFMWLLGHSKRAAIYPEMIMLDEMWHNFILFTVPYREYCEEHFGRFLDHKPSTRAEERRRESLGEAERESEKADYLVEYERQLTRTQDFFGEETVVCWHLTYRNRYNAQFFESKRRPMSTLHRADVQL